MSTLEARRRARLNWRAAHREKYNAQQRRNRLHKRWRRVFARMGLEPWAFETAMDEVQLAPNDLPPAQQSPAAIMMQTYEALLALQEQRCAVCAAVADLTVPIFDTRGQLWRFACEPCAVFVREDGGDE